jgi:hypothetical protein
MKDTFIKDYWTLPESDTQKIRDLKDKAQELFDMIEITGVKSREMSLAVTNLEQAMMWCTKAIVLTSKA